MSASKLLINEPPLQVLPGLAVRIGLNEAMIAQQLHWWLLTGGHERDGRRWVYNTHKDWQEKFPFWSISTIRRALDNLIEKLHLVDTANYNARPGDQTLWYSINYEVMALIEAAPAPAKPYAHFEQLPTEPAQPVVQNEQASCSERAGQLLILDRPLPERSTKKISKDVCADSPPTGNSSNPTHTALKRRKETNDQPLAAVACAPAPEAVTVPVPDAGLIGRAWEPDPTLIAAHAHIRDYKGNLRFQIARFCDRNWKRPRAEADDLFIGFMRLADPAKEPKAAPAATPARRYYDPTTAESGIRPPRAQKDRSP